MQTRTKVGAGVIFAGLTAVAVMSTSTVPPESCPVCPITEPILTERPTLPPAELGPERGFYVGINLLTSGYKAPAIRASGHTLAIALVRLDDFRNAPITPAVLDGLTMGFRAIRAAGIKVVLRFMYNSAATPDAPLARVLEHIKQLTPVLKSNADVIAVVQAGFIGGWGEWHGSTNGLDTSTNRGLILRALLTALPSSRSVQIRTPHFKDEAFPGGPLTAREDTLKGRVGHHNDCFLATDSDYGTYKSPVAFWKSYVAQEGRFTPIGGETCKVYSPRTDCPSALAELATNRWSYLNEQYHTGVVDSWRAQGCFTEISQRLGHRLAITKWAMSDQVRPGGIVRIEAEIENSGFAAPFNARPVYIRIGAQTLFLPVDPRTWQPGSTSLAWRVQVPRTAAPGVYPVSLWLPDAAPSIRGDARYDLSIPGEFALTVDAYAIGAAPNTKWGIEWGTASE